MADKEHDADMAEKAKEGGKKEEKGDKADEALKKGKPVFEVKKWNAVALWAWDLVVDNCAICRRRNTCAMELRKGKHVGKYELGKTLGEGAYGKVKQARDTETGKQVAIKMMDKSKIREKKMDDQIRKEISVMKLIEHENVIRLLEVLDSKTTIFIVTEGKFTEDTARGYFRQLIDGIDYCHARDVVHRDLKPENLLLDASNVLKVSDFGLSAITGVRHGKEQSAHAQVMHTACGTPNYVAPEVLLGRGYEGKAADVWSAGVILYVLLAGFLPFDEASMVELFRKIVRADVQFPKWMSKEAISLLCGILNAEPTKRFTIKQIKEHPWFRRGLKEEKEEKNAAPDKATESNSERQTTAQTAQAQIAQTVQTSPPAHAPTKTLATKDSTDPDREHKEKRRERTKHQSTGPLTLNAFEFVNMISSAGMQRLLKKQQQTAQSPTQSPTQTDTKHTPLALQPKTLSQFTSSLTNEVLLSIIKTGLDKIPHCTYKARDQRCRFKIQARSTKGDVSVSARVYAMSARLQLVHVRRIKGDMFAFYDFFGAFKSNVESLEKSELRKHPPPPQISPQNYTPTHTLGARTPSHAHTRTHVPPACTTSPLGSSAPAAAASAQTPTHAPAQAHALAQTGQTQAPMLSPIVIGPPSAGVWTPQMSASTSAGVGSGPFSATIGGTLTSTSPQAQQANGRSPRAAAGKDKDKAKDKDAPVSAGVTPITQPVPAGSEP